jgi:Polysaccharide lyase
MTLLTSAITALRQSGRYFLASLLLATAAHAVPYAGNFSNSGTTTIWVPTAPVPSDKPKDWNTSPTNWSTFSGYAPGITSASPPVANSGVAIKCVLPRDPTVPSDPWKNRRIGVRRYYAGEEGKTFTYQFSFLSPSIAPVTAANMKVWIWQALVHDPDRIAESGSAAWRPLVSLSYEGGSADYSGWYLYYYTGIFPDDLVTNQRRIRLPAATDSSVWHNWKIKVKYSSNSDGYIIVWSLDSLGNETRVHEVSNVATWPQGIGPKYNLMACFENYVVSGWASAGPSLTKIESYYDVISLYKNP